MMKTNVCTVLCALVLAAAFGCQQTVPPTDKPETNKTGHDHAGHDHAGHDHAGHDHAGHDHGSAGYVEPLVPKTDEAKPAEKPAPVPAVEPAKPAQPAPAPVQPAAPAPVPKTSAVPSVISGKFAADAVPLPPVADLTAQIGEYAEKIGKNLEELDGSTKYKDDAEQIVRDANGLILVTKAAGLAADDSKYKKSAPQIIAAAKKLEAADNLDAGQKAFAALKDALAGKGDAGTDTLSWDTKTAALKPVMKAVPNLNSAIKRTSDKETKLKKTLEKKPAQLFGGLAALAAIAQGSIANVKDTAKPDAEAEWKKECEQLRDTALKANVAAHAFAEGKADYAAFSKAMESVNNSCHDCHKIFSPENAEKTE